VNFDKATGGTRSGVQQEAAYPGAARAATEGPQKCDKSRAFASLWWSYLCHIFAALWLGHVPIFDTWPRDTPRCPP